MAEKELRTVDDFLDVPEEELYRCLQAFRLALLKTKVDRAAAAEHGLSARSIAFDTFVWNPRPADDTPVAPPTGITPIEELPLRHAVRVELKRMHVFCLEDFSMVTETEFAVIPNVGLGTVQAIRERLTKIGLSFKPSDNPESRLYEQNRLARRVPVEERLASVTDESSIAALGLTPGTYSRARHNRHRTVADLCVLKLRDVMIAYGKRQALEIITLLRHTGRDLADKPTKTDLWHAGLIPRSELPMPASPDTPIGELAPWIGSAVARNLRESDVKTIGELVQLVQDRKVQKIPGVGRKTYGDLVDVLKRAGFADTATPK